MWINAWWHAVAVLLLVTQFVWIFWVMDLFGRYWGYAFACAASLLLVIRPTTYKEGRLSWTPSLRSGAWFVISVWGLFWVWLVLGHNVRQLDAWGLWPFFISVGIVWLVLWLRERGNA